LKRFLYQPILNAIDTREKGIASSSRTLKRKEADAHKQQEDFEAKNKSFDEQRAALMTKAAGDAKVEHDRLVDDAHKQAGRGFAPLRRPRSKTTKHTRLFANQAHGAGPGLRDHEENAGRSREPSPWKSGRRGLHSAACG